MTNTIYKISTEAGTFYVSANLVEASAGIYTYFGDYIKDVIEDDEDRDGCSWQATRFQTADFGHSENKMAVALAREFDMGTVMSTETY